MYPGGQYNKMWAQLPNQGENQVMPLFQNEMMQGSNSSKDIALKKTPWTLDEEQVFWEKHEILGNKWVEIAKSLPGRNDNTVKNYFYSSIRKYIRKIAKGRISAEQKTSPIAKKLSIYFTQYIRRMYAEYLKKVALKQKQSTNWSSNEDNGMDVDMQTDEQRQQILKDYEMEESKEEKAKSMKTGEKYIIRKLISFKINIPKIDDYLMKLNALEVNNDQMKQNQFYVNKNTNNGIDNILNNYGNPMSASTTQNSNQYFPQMGFGQNNPNQFRTFQGHNDDSQIAYHSNNFLFQPQMSQPNPFFAMQSQMMNQMQNLSINNPNMCWDGMNCNNQNSASPQIPVNQQNYGNMQGCHQVDTGMQNYNYPQVNPFVQSNFSHSSNSAFGQGYNNQEQPVPVPLGNQDSEETKELPAEMRLPSHVKNKHFRSNSVTPIDTNTGGYMKDSFLFDKVNPNSGVAPKPLKLGKFNSEKIAANSAGVGSTNSLPAIRNLSDYQDSYASESSVFDGNDSAYASSIDIELDENGQPVFDRMSNMGDSLSGKEGNEEGSEEVQVMGRTKPGVKKKSGFAPRERNDSVSSESDLD